MKIKSLVSHAVLGLSLLSGSVMADWTLNNEKSALFFVSIKKTDVAEIHRFNQMSGTISDAGKAQLSIDLNSVSTQIPIRDERMKTMLFETKQHKTATIDVDLSKVGLKPGLQKVEVTLDLHGVQKPLTALVNVSETDNTVYVTSSAPILLNAKAFNLGKGVDALRDIAQLNHISYTVPVTFSLGFDKTK